MVPLPSALWGILARAPEPGGGRACARSPRPGERVVRDARAGAGCDPARAGGGRLRSCDPPHRTVWNGFVLFWQARPDSRLVPRAPHRGTRVASAAVGDLRVGLAEMGQ